MNRVLTDASRRAALRRHRGARPDNLTREGVDPETVHVTGNSGIDAVLYIRDLLRDRSAAAPADGPGLDPARKLIVVTAHRRESFGEGFERICRALGRLAERAGSSRSSTRSIPIRTCRTRSAAI